MANALGSPPKDVVDLAHEHGVKVAALCGSVQQAERHVNQGVDIVVAQGGEAGGHTGDVASLVLWPDVVDAIAPTPVLAAGGIGTGRQIAAALALGCEGVWTGSIWLTTAESDTGTDGDGEAARGGRPRHRAVAQLDGQAGAHAAHRVDRGVGARGLARGRCRCRSSSC